MDCSDDTRRLDIVLKIIKDGIVRGTDEIRRNESNGGVTGSCHGIEWVTCKN